MIGKTRFFIGIAALLSGVAAWGAQLTPEQALSRVATLPTADKARFAAPRVSSLQLCKTAVENGNATYYVFNGSDKGFYIVAADDVVSTPVLGFSDEGVFDPDNIPVNMADMLNDYSAQISAMIARGGEPSSSDANVLYLAAAASGRSDVAPLCKTLWDQGAPYFNLCPEKNNEHAFTGCVATAMAQAMKVFNWPAKGIGTNSYASTDGDFKGVRLTVDFSSSVYDWANMLPDYSSAPNATDAQKNAIARLMYDCGVAVDMNYNLTASGASSTDIAPAMIKYFNYDKGCHQVWREYYGYNDWINLLYEELSNGRPILAGGSNTGGGHAFVIDGYRAEGDYFHVNWGWSGLSNGYFLANALDPESQGAGGSTAGYNVGHMVTIGIQPAKEGSVAPVILGANIDFSVQTSTGKYDRSDAVVFFPGMRNYGVFNYSTVSVAPIVGVKLVNNSTKEEQYIGVQLASSISTMGGFTSFAIQGNRFPSEGTWTVTPVYRVSEDDPWQDVIFPLGMRNSMRLVANAATLTFSSIAVGGSIRSTVFEISEETLYNNRPFQLKTNLSSLSGEFYRIMYLVLTNAEATKIITTLDMFQADVLPATTQTFNLTPFMPAASAVPPGAYKLGIGYSSGTGVSFVGGLHDITVAAEPSAGYRVSKIEFKGSDKPGLFQTLPANVSLNDFHVTMGVECTDGYFSDIISGLVFNTAGKSLLQLNAGFIKAIVGDVAEFEIKGDVSTQLEANQVYCFAPFGAVNGQMVNTPRYFKGTKTGIEAVSAEEAGVVMVIYPGSEMLNIVSPEALGKAELYDMQGAVVAVADGNGQTSMNIDMGGICPGVYVVRVMSGNKTVMRKIVK